MVVDQRVSRISSFVVTLGWSIGPTGGSERVVVRALKIWIGADLERVQPH